MEFIFEDIKKDVPVQLAKYIINHVVEAYIRKVPFNSWMVKVIKGHNRAIRHLYCVKDSVRVYRL